MTTTTNKSLHEVDWSKLPAPQDDGGAKHLTGAAIPDLELAAIGGGTINLSSLPGFTAVFAYPMTGRPDRELPQDWDMIPGARGCTPQACAFRDLNNELTKAGIHQMFGVSTQSSDDQTEAAARLHLPFLLLSDKELTLQKALTLPTMTVESSVLLKRLTLIINNGKIVKVFYPVFPPDRSADDVLTWAQANTEDV